MGEMKDGGPYFAHDVTIRYPDTSGRTTHYQGVTLRARLAMQFAAAWLAIVAINAGNREPGEISARANELGLAMADDLLRRLKGES